MRINTTLQVDGGAEEEGVDEDEEGEDKDVSYHLFLFYKKFEWFGIS